MKEKPKVQLHRPEPAHPTNQQGQPDKQRQKAETIEVLGRHKNTGQKNDKGAR